MPAGRCTRAMCRWPPAVGRAAVRRPSRPAGRRDGDPGRGRGQDLTMTRTADGVAGGRARRLPADPATRFATWRGPRRPAAGRGQDGQPRTPRSAGARGSRGRRQVARSVTLDEDGKPVAAASSARRSTASMAADAVASTSGAAARSRPGSPPASSACPPAPSTGGHASPTSRNEIARVTLAADSPAPSWPPRRTATPPGYALEPPPPEGRKADEEKVNRLAETLSSPGPCRT